jgi:LPS sulfotransferase NodH
VGAVTRRLRTWAPRPLHRLLAPKQRFVILTSGRSGSDLLVSLLDSHPQIMCDGEVLMARRTLPDQLVRSREALAGLRRARAYGFKLTRDNILAQGVEEPAGFVRALHERGYRMVLLERRDLLQHAISYVRAEQVGYIHYRRAAGGPFSATALDPMAVVAFMYVLEDVAHFCRGALSGIPHIKLVYEDDLVTTERQQAAADRICRALGLHPATVRSDLVRVTPGATEDQLSNYDELAEMLARTRYAQYLPERAPSTEP